MEANLHRLLKRQIKRVGLENNPNFNQAWLKPLLEAVSEAYFDFDQSIKHLENILEVSSNELFKKTQSLDQINKSLAQIVEERTRQVYEQNIELAQFSEETAAQRDVLETKATELERVNLKLLQSIQYARRLQDVMLPQKSMLKNLFKESFLIYKPKDIISGDFYWVFERRDKIIFGVIDCTGHGVPGAFMSLLVNDMLRLIVEVKNIVEPAEILAEMHKEITIAFKQETTFNNDGADAALCQWDKKARILRFAGAKLSLFVQEEDGAFQVLKGDRISLGGNQFRKDPNFHEYIIHLKKNISIYLSSDGFYDQLGGEKSRRMGFNRFIQKLHEFALEPFPNQAEKLLHFFNNWKTSFPVQLDDVTVLGIRLSL
jgi:serine phosphatase RsbU (regulator of sigma subunit)